MSYDTYSFGMFKPAFNDHHITASSENYVSLRDGADDVPASGEPVVWNKKMSEILRSGGFRAVARLEGGLSEVTRANLRRAIKENQFPGVGDADDMSNAFR